MGNGITGLKTYDENEAKNRFKTQTEFCGVFMGNVIIGLKTYDENEAENRFKTQTEFCSVQKGTAS